MKIISPGFHDSSVRQPEIELAFLRFYQIPANRRERGVKMAGGKLAQYGSHVVQTGGSGIVQFTTENQERLAVHNQLCGRAVFGEMRNWVCLRPGRLDRDAPKNYAAKDGPRNREPETKFGVHI